MRGFVTFALAFFDCFLKFLLGFLAGGFGRSTLRLTDPFGLFTAWIDCVFGFLASGFSSSTLRLDFFTVWIVCSIGSNTVVGVLWAGKRILWKSY